MYQSLQCLFQKVGAVEQRIELRHVRRALLLRSEIRDAQHLSASETSNDLGIVIVDICLLRLNGHSVVEYHTKHSTAVLV